MKEIKLTQGKVALVDAEDYERVNQFCWYAVKGSQNCWYARRSLYTRGSGERKIQSLHRFIMNAPHGVQVDHRNGDGLDCRKQNMRLASDTENKRNRGKYKNNTSGYRGVFRSENRWIAQVRVGRRKEVLLLWTPYTRRRRSRL